MRRLMPIRGSAGTGTVQGKLGVDWQWPDPTTVLVPLSTAVEPALLNVPSLRSIQAL
jgi:hypothetical protein